MPELNTACFLAWLSLPESAHPAPCLHLQVWCLTMFGLGFGSPNALIMAL